jgi:hypothetical protein
VIFDFCADTIKKATICDLKQTVTNLFYTTKEWLYQLFSIRAQQSWHYCTISGIDFTNTCLRLRQIIKVVLLLKCRFGVSVSHTLHINGKAICFSLSLPIYHITTGFWIQVLCDITICKIYAIIKYAVHITYNQFFLFLICTMWWFNICLT